MPDVATLGLSVDSSQVAKGTSALDGLSNAAKRAEAAAAGISSSTRNASAAAASLAASTGQASAALNAQASAAQKAAAAMSLHTAAANSNIRAASNLNTANIAAQLQDIAVSAQSGMGALQIGLQQGTQLAAIISSMERPLHGLGAAFLSVISPVSLLVIGLTALAAVGLQNVDWTKLAQRTLKVLADSLQTVAPYAVGAAAAIALLYAPQIIGGMVQLIALMGRLAVSAGIAAAAMVAANPAGAFVLGVTAAVAALAYFSDSIKKTFGVDVIGTIKTSANYIIGSFMAAFHDLQYLWGSFPDIIEAAAIGAVNAVIRATNSMLDAVRTGVNSLIEYVNTVGEKVGLTIDPVRAGTGIPELANPAAGRLSGIGAERDARIAQDLSRNYLGDFGRGIAKGASAAADALRDLHDWMGKVDEKGKASRGGGKTEAEKYSDIVDGANRRIASLKAEQAALGMTEEEALKLRYTQDLLNQAQQKGITLTTAQRAELASLAGQMARLEIETQRMKAAQQAANEYTYGFFRGMIIEGKSAREALSAILTQMADDLLRFALTGQGTFAQIFGPGGGLFGGVFGTGNLAQGQAIGSTMASIFHAGGIVGGSAVAQRAVPASLFYGAPRLHSGLMPGEFAAILQRGEMVIPRSMVGRAQNDNAARGGKTEVHIHGAPAGTEVRETQGPNGPRVDVYFKGLVHQDIADRGPLARQLEQRYGLRPKG